MLNLKFKLILGAVVWGFYLPFLLLITAVSYVLAPVIALPCFVRHDATARESLPSTGRERLVNWLYWFQTYDNPLDEGFYGGYGKHQWVNRYRANYGASGLSEYMFRVYWLWRNAVYGFARWPFGADCELYRFEKFDGERGVLFFGVSSVSEPFKPYKGWFVPFSLSWQYSATRRLWIGWKITRVERDGLARKMFVFQPYKRV